VHKILFVKKKPLLSQNKYETIFMKTKNLTTNFSILSELDLTQQQKELVNKAKEAAGKAYAPYSQFQVGAAVLLENGQIVTGNNQENAAYPSGLCAERTAVFYANAQYPDEPVKAIAIAARTAGKWLENPISPCGSCRQALLETERRFGADIQVLLYGKKEILLIDSIKSLLPFAFSLTE
jgi:cytidine deaminase